MTKANTWRLRHYIWFRRLPVCGVREDRRIVTDGPFAETTEQLGGYYIIDVDHLDEAIAIASRLPPAKKGTVEIRPIFELPEIPVKK